MAKSNKGSLPEILFVAPIGGGKQKIKHRHAVFEITEFAPDGWPLVLRLVRDDEVVDLRTEEGSSKSFMPGYCQERSLGPWTSLEGG